MVQYKTIDVLKRAKKRLLEHPTQNAYARDSAGRPVDSIDPKAVCWCALGAIEVESRGLTYYELRPLLVALRKLGGSGIVYINDAQGPKAAARIFDLAIAELERK